MINSKKDKFNAKLLSSEKKLKKQAKKKFSKGLKQEKKLSSKKKAE